MTQNIILWDTPVSAHGRLIFGPYEAHQFIIAHWQLRTDLHAAVAKKCVLMAMDGRASPDQARELFEAALEEDQIEADFKLAV